MVDGISAGDPALFSHFPRIVAYGAEKIKSRTLPFAQGEKISGKDIVKTPALLYNDGSGVPSETESCLPPRQGEERER